ncbi:putative nucleic-acid-binding protein, contains PIN domain (plasmid) [Rickettsiales bacterium Ac37b]|nr:putative nucleic-acid-binding protein, contains PIN domain [Rickettsiales bacterium Ac37b]
MGDHQEYSPNAVKLFEDVQIGNKQIIILETILTECVFILSSVYKVPKQDIYDSLSGLLLYKGVVNIDKETLLEGLKIYNSRNLHIVDSILIAKALISGCEIYSFDQKLNKEFELLYNQR